MNREHAIQEDKQEMYQAIFYFYRSNVVHGKQLNAVCFCLLISSGFLVSYWFANLTAARGWIYINYFFTGFLLGIPVVIISALWHRKHCLNKVLFEKKGITVNQRFFSAADIGNLRIQGEYIKVETVQGKMYSYWVGSRLPVAIENKLLLEIENLQAVSVHG